MADSIQRVVLIGAGNVGSHLARALQEAGVEIIQVYSRTFAHAKALATEYGATFTDDLKTLTQDGDLYIFAIKDDALAQLQLNLEGKRVVHTSGAMPGEVLKKNSSHYGVFYPLQTFTSGLEVDWKKIPVCVEASDPEMLEALRELATRIAGLTLYTQFADRQKLHAAAVFVNNFTNYLLRNAEEIVGRTAIPFSVLQPLAEETIRKAFLISPVEAQTGPAIRGDEKTIAVHKKLLAGTPDIEAVYEFLTAAIQKSAAGNQPGRS